MQATPEFGPGRNRYVQSVVLSARPGARRLSYVAESSLGFQTDGKTDGGTASWYGVDGYFTYKLNCCWTAALRGEWSARPGR